MKKASGDEGIPAELFQILKDNAVKMLHSICQQIWKIHKKPQDRKRSIFIIGDWNAKIGSQEIPGITGKFGLGV